MDSSRNVHGDTGELAHIVQRNIRALLEVRRREDAGRALSDLLADHVSVFIGSMKSVAIHGLLFAS